MDSEAGAHDDRFEGPVTVDLLADLRAGLLDDRSAAQLRRRARTDPAIAGQLASLDRIRRNVAELGVDAASAQEVPAGVTARIGAVLRAQPTPAAEHGGGRVRRAAAVAGIAAVIIAGALGTAMLVRNQVGDSLPVVADRRTGGLALSADEIAALLSQPPDLGALNDPERRVSCLGGLGYPTATVVLGAQPLVVDGTAGVLMLLPGDGPKRLDAVVVAPNCSSVDTGLLASRVVDRP